MLSFLFLYSLAPKPMEWMATLTFKMSLPPQLIYILSHKHAQWFVPIVILNSIKLKINYPMYYQF